MGQEAQPRGEMDVGNDRPETAREGGSQEAVRPWLQLSVDINNKTKQHRGSFPSASYTQTSILKITSLDNPDSQSV